jgi:hypothetical protein
LAEEYAQQYSFYILWHMTLDNNAALKEEELLREIKLFCHAKGFMPKGMVFIQILVLNIFQIDAYHTAKIAMNFI